MREPGRSGCPACRAPGVAERLCHECVYASAVARAVHPSSGGAAAAGSATSLGDDFELWEAQALLGDPGPRYSGDRPEQ